MATMTLEGLVTQLRSALGEALRAVVLFGSAVAGEHYARRSDQNVLVLVDALGLPVLERVSPTARAWREAGNAPPLAMTVEEWRRSADIFAMEYADILSRHRVLHGSLPVDGIAVRPEMLRLQLEREARGKVIQLRRGILAAGGDRARLVGLLEESLSTFMVLFRALLRLHGEEPPTDYEALARSAAALTGSDAGPFVQVVRHVRGGPAIARGTVMELVAGYLDGAERLAAHVDALESEA